MENFKNPIFLEFWAITNFSVFRFYLDFSIIYYHTITKKKKTTTTKTKADGKKWKMAYLLVQVLKYEDKKAKVASIKILVDLDVS